MPVVGQLQSSASSESLPGEWLYPAKRAAEKTQATVADVVGNKNDVQTFMVTLPKEERKKPETFIKMILRKLK